MFGGGTSRLQPVYVGDLARAVEILSINDTEVNELVSGKIIEAGGPDGMYIFEGHVRQASTILLSVFTYREIMELVLKYNQRRRPIISVPFWVGILQGAILENLPVNLFTVTRAQVS